MVLRIVGSSLQLVFRFLSISSFSVHIVSVPGDVFGVRFHSSSIRLAIFSLVRSKRAVSDNVLCRTQYAQNDYRSILALVTFVELPAARYTNHKIR